MPCPGVTRQCALPAAPVRLPSCCSLPNARRPMPMLCPVSAGLPAPHFVFTQALLRRPEHPTWYTSRRPLDYTFWLLFSPSLPGQSRARTALLCRPRQSWAPNILTNVLFLPRPSPTTIMLVAAHSGAIPQYPRHPPFLHCSLSHLNKLPTHLTAQILYRVAGDASSSNVGLALLPANGHLATPTSLQPLRANCVTLTPPLKLRRHRRYHGHDQRCSVHPVRSRGNPHAFSLGGPSLL